MLKRFRLLPTATAALVAVVLATAVPAQADVMDCIETVAPPEVKQAVEDAARLRNASARPQVATQR